MNPAGSANTSNSSAGVSYIYTPNTSVAPVAPHTSVGRLLLRVSGRLRNLALRL